MTSPTLDTLAGEVSGPALMQDVTEFAKRVKLSGTSEELESFKYLKKQAESYGYTTELILHDAYISLPGNAHVEVDGQTLDSNTHSFSRPSPAGGLRAKLVYLGEGTAADFANSDVRDKIVLVEGIASPAVAARASAAGALGQLHISPNEYRYEMCISPVWGSPSRERLERLPTTVVCTISNPDGAVLRDRLEKGEAPDVALFAEVDTGWRKTPILVAELLPANAPDDTPYVLFSGHHDTWYYGVMDNGSANATMLETARVLAGHRDLWRRGLRLCFWSGHSHGRYSGSAWYVDENWDDLERRCIAHVNVDSTGGIGANVLTASGVSSELAMLARDEIEAVSGQIHAGKRSARSADASFWGVGIPSMFGSMSHQALTPGKMRNALGWWWHTPHDTIDKIDEANLVRDTKVFVRVIWRLLTDRVLPLHQASQVETLLAELAPLTGVALDELVKAVETLRDKMATARAQAEAGGDAERINAAMLRVARALVPLDYTEGDRFQHDAALPMPAWPVLQPLRDLTAIADGDERAFAAVEARRARNRVLHALRQANTALDLALSR